MVHRLTECRVCVLGAITGVGILRIKGLGKLIYVARKVSLEGCAGYLLVGKLAYLCLAVELLLRAFYRELELHPIVTFSTLVLMVSLSLK